MNNNRVVVLIPIESYAREFDGRLLLAASLAERGFFVIMGDHIFIRYVTYLISNGIYIGKNMYMYPAPFGKKVKNYFGRLVSDIWYYKILKKRGYSTIHLEEEGGFFSNKFDLMYDFLDSRLSVGILKEDDYIATWGEIQKNHYKQKGADFPNNIIATGNPRFDVYKKKYRKYYQHESDKLIKSFGSYILINTNYSLSNYSMREKGMFRESSIYSAKDDKLKMLGVGKWHEQAIRFSNLIALIFELSVNLKNETFVIRAHPSEREDTYKEIFKGIKNIVVAREGSVGPWINGCKVLLHDGCTTGLEAALLEKPIINYNSFDSQMNNNELLSEIGMQATNPKEVIDTIIKLNTTSQGPSTYEREILKMTSILLNCDIEGKKYSTKILTNLICDLRKRHAKEKSRFANHIVIRLIYAFYSFTNILRFVVLSIYDGNLFRHKNRKSVGYGISRKDFKDKVCAIDSINSSSTKVKYISRRCFTFQQEKQ